jgi:hypothetical protein
MPRHLMFLLLVVLAVGCAVPLGHSEVVGVRHVLRQIPVAGRLEHGGTFAGRLTVEALTINELGQLAATGVLAGTATPGAGSTTPIPPRTVSTPASLLDLRGTCTTLGAGCRTDLPGAAQTRGDAGANHPGHAGCAKGRASLEHHLVCPGTSPGIRPAAHSFSAPCAEAPVTGPRGGAGHAAQPAAPLRHEMASPGTVPDCLQETLSPQDSRYRPSRR